jgi:hypothetical protein
MKCRVARVVNARIPMSPVADADFQHGAQTGFAHLLLHASRDGHGVGDGHRLIVEDCGGVLTLGGRFHDAHLIIQSVVGVFKFCCESSIFFPMLEHSIVRSKFGGPRFQVIHLALIAQDLLWPFGRSSTELDGRSTADRGRTEPLPPSRIESRDRTSRCTSRSYHFCKGPSDTVRNQSKTRPANKVVGRWHQRPALAVDWIMAVVRAVAFAHSFSVVFKPHERTTSTRLTIRPSLQCFRQARQIV